MDKAKFKRNNDGLYDHIEYQYDDNGYINWRAMIPKEFIVPNKNNFENLKEKEIEALNVDDLDEKDLIILLGGFKYVAKLRGFSSCHTTVRHASDNKIVCECHIIWRSNYETEWMNNDSSGVGEASLINTKGFGQKFLGPIAENRAFVRCVRNFLNINIVGNDEMIEGYDMERANKEDVEKMAEATTHTGLLKRALEEKGSDFKTLQKALINEGGPEAEEVKKWESINDISPRKAMEIVSTLRSFGQDESETETAPKKKRGRKKGSKNQPKLVTSTE